MRHLYKHTPYIVWTIALLSAVGSLYFQYVLRYPPCTLCWYQRIFIYPLVFIIPIGLVKKDHALRLYTVVLSAVGLAISFYHNLLYYHIIPESLAPCVQGVACTTRYVNFLGFLDIPQLSFLALLMVLILSLIFWKE